MKTSNPALGDKTFTDLANAGPLGDVAAAGRMTLSGTVNKTGILLLCCIATAAWTWRLFLQSAGDASDVGGLMIVGLIGGFIVAMVTIFKKEWAPVTSPIYALLEGLVLGGISAVTNARYPGIGIAGGRPHLRHAVRAAAGLQLRPHPGHARSSAWASSPPPAASPSSICWRWCSASSASTSPPSTATASSASASAWSWSSSPRSTWCSTSTSSRRGVKVGAPKYMEWYGAFGIMVTLVWLYLEILRLLSKVRSRN